MTRNHFWKLFIILAVVGWSFLQIYPPFNTPLGQEFQQRAFHPDKTFDEILAKYREYQTNNPETQYANMLKAVGTNDITKYFPFVEVKNQPNPTRTILNTLQRDASGKIKLGIDLKGGTSVRMQMDTARLPAGADVQSALNEAVEVLRKRVDRLGVSEPVIQAEGKDQILVQLPGLEEAQKENAVNQLKQAAFLEFRLVHPNSEELIKQNIIEPGYEVKTLDTKDENGQQVQTKYLVTKKPAGGITGQNVTSVRPERDQTGRLYVAFKLDSAGAAAFDKLTKENVGHQLAIVLDGQLRSAPVIKEEIPNGNVSIDGGERGFTLEQVKELVNILQNPLKAPLKVLSSSAVEPTLGKETIRSGVTAAIVGTILVSLFMAIYYLRGGLVANFALLLNVVILLGVMCSIGATFTLPGIAGVVLTIGMAVDANVLIFERIREELATGKSMRGALAAGYDKAFGTIFDSNLTTIISSLILIWMGTGPVKGFGITLTIGVCASMFTALVVTRLIFDWLLSINKLKSLKMLHIIRGTHLDFMRWAMPAFIASWTLILIGNSYGIFVRGHNVLGIDFAGGEQQVYAFTPLNTAAEKAKLRQDVHALGESLQMGDVTPQIQRSALTGVETLRVVTPFGGDTNSTAAVMYKAMQEKLPQYNFKRMDVERVGPIIGEAITQAAIVASLLAMFGILIYVAFRYEFSFAIGAVLAIIHDILMTLGWFFLSGRELSAPIVAAVLTIIGFSINDTIVIFDRIREDLKLGVRGTFREVMNQALNQTLSRTLITSGTVFLATAALYWLGTGTIQDFAFTFLVGILTGTYSSIYIASALVLWWHKGQRPKIGSGPVQAQVATPAVARARA